MIVRITTEGQYRLTQEAMSRLNDLDDAAVVAVERGDHAGFGHAFSEMLGIIRSGERLADDELLPSDLIVPPPETTIEEAAADFVGEGLIPD